MIAKEQLDRIIDQLHDETNDDSEVVNDFIISLYYRWIRTRPTRLINKITSINKTTPQV